LSLVYLELAKRIDFPMAGVGHARAFFNSPIQPMKWQFLSIRFIAGKFYLSRIARIGCGKSMARLHAWNRAT
jgi:hypothetical protein